jgi:hypothetical protein
MQKKMINVTDKNRKDIIRTYASRLLDDMDFDSLYSFAYDTISSNKSMMTNNALENEIVFYYPDILEE